MLRPRREQQGLLALARAGGEQHRARPDFPAQGFTERELLRRRQGVELHVAQHLDFRRAQRAQADGILFRLCGEGGEALQGAARQIGEAGVTPCRFFRQARVRQQQRDARFLASRHQVRPELGFHDDADGRPEMPQEASHGKRVVVGQVGALDAVAEQRFGSAAAGRRHVREQDAMARIARLERGDDRRSGARLADRDGMQPYNPFPPPGRGHPVHSLSPLGRGLGRGVTSKTLADMTKVLRLAAAAQEQMQADVGQQEQQRQVVEEASHHSRSITASMTCSTAGGASAPPRLMAVSPA